jgi:hypothetical protein
MASNREREPQIQPLTGEKILAAVIEIVVQQREIRKLQAARDGAMALVHRLLGVDQTVAWPASPSDVPEEIRSEVERASLEYLIAREAALRGVKEYGYPGCLEAKYMGVRVSISAHESGDVSPITVVEPDIHSSSHALLTASTPTEVTGVTARSAKIGEGVLTIIPEGSARGVFAEVRAVTPELVPQVDIFVLDREQPATA